MVIWSQPARADLRAIHDYIAQDSPFYAKKVVQDIRERADTLEPLPKTGKKVPEVTDDQIREISLYSYRIIYKTDSQELFILAVVHKRRDLKPEDINQNQ